MPIVKHPETICVWLRPETICVWLRFIQGNGLSYNSCQKKTVMNKECEQNTLQESSSSSSEIITLKVEVARQLPRS